MPYALFSNDAKLSKAYPTAADVWKIAQKNDLVVDVVSEDDKQARIPCWIMTTKSSRASSSRMKTPPETRPRPKAKRRRNCSWRRDGDGGQADNRRPSAYGSRSPGTTSEAVNRFYGVAEASDACSAVRVPQALRRCSPLIAPVTLRTLPAPHEGSCTKATS